MITPRIEIDLKKIETNTRNLIKLYSAKGIHVTGVSKVLCGNLDVVSVLIKCGVQNIADSRLSNIIRMFNAGIKTKFLLLRAPFLSQIKDVIKYVDISLNSEIIVIEALSECALKYKRKHSIILMVELGDLREGILPKDIHQIIKKVLRLEGINLIGIGTNLACFGGVEPDDKNMSILSSLANKIENTFNIKLNIISGGNSANYKWFNSTNNIGRINNLRIGESIFLGRETINRKIIPDLYTNAFTLIAEVIESKLKPTLPTGTISQDAFGFVKTFKDRGLTNRAILGIGVQDVCVSGLTPRANIKILGASSDHLVVDTNTINYEIGTELEFDLNYSSLLSVMTSPYVQKQVI